MSATQSPSEIDIGWNLLGSILSALTGWASLIVYGFGSLLVQAATDPADGLGNHLFVPIVAGVFIFPVWLFLLLPLYLFVPERSVFWRWPVCTLCGTAGGGAIMFAFCAFAFREITGSLPLVALAALAGAATCLFGAWTRSKFRFRRCA